MYHPYVESSSVLQLSKAGKTMRDYSSTRMRWLATKSGQSLARIIQKWNAYYNHCKYEWRNFKWCVYITQNKRHKYSGRKCSSRIRNLLWNWCKHSNDSAFYLRNVQTSWRIRVHLHVDPWMTVAALYVPCKMISYGIVVCSYANKLQILRICVEKWNVFIE